ncbi:hypothetical protein AA12717_2597 [Gluconacetobacter sacchari DSM 12717]|uniref:Quinol monooxygenase YgiN n=2 Tax=Gluconacetobacter sacchari TaxID=92759 RepID=A0A7W4NQG8_9PROT|nr:hypothetical protein [Gluconacetobacter sacchari]MBB2159973.1 hypothetical protein [Gluconacetobacter sacchari]GBQ27196.1 hypothetical protein AA12717_2597 [Gluconacetobacter sacchari DSM 12717]
MGDVVIVAYRPKPGQEQKLLELTRNHVPALRRLGLATDRPTLAMRSREGIIVEIFEWQEGALQTAHAHPDVLAMWERYAAVCDYVPLHELPESRDMFAQFEPIDL